jgi:hypothetical protein
MIRRDFLQLASTAVGHGDARPMAPLECEVSLQLDALMEVR